MTEIPASDPAPRVPRGQIVMAAVLMLATLPGRTQGLGLITDPMLRDLRLDDVTYAQVTLWAALLSSVFCLPAGRLIDRFGLRWPAAVTLLLLAPPVAALGVMEGGALMLFLWIFLARGIGQSALSVVSITAASRAAGKSSMAMAAYAVLLTVFMGAAFPAIGALVRGPGWRVAWLSVAAGVAVIAVAAWFVLPGRPSASPGKEEKPAAGHTLAEALRTRAFWVFGGAIALFSFVSAGVGLFNEAVLAERGFERATYHNVFLPVLAVTALAGQFLSGWLSRRWSLGSVLALSMLLQGLALAAVPVIGSLTGLVTFATVYGASTGIITVVFFAVWGEYYGQAHLGRIQGAAQAFTVLASALGPLVFAASHRWWHSYTPVLLALAVPMFGFAAAGWLLRRSPAGR